MGRSGSYLNNSITSAWSEHSLDPEDIRVTKLQTLDFIDLYGTFYTQSRFKCLRTTTTKN